MDLNSSDSHLYSSEDIEQLIHEYKAHPELWQVSHTLYKDRYSRDASLREIAAKLKMTVGAVKGKIKILRTQYNAERRKRRSRRAAYGTDGRAVKWRWFQALDFLRDGFKHRQTQAATTLVDVCVQVFLNLNFICKI